jgi:nucleoporin SEH1
MQVHRFQSGHGDLVHDLSYDYYGRRIATVSSDQRCKVWDLEDIAEGRRWVLNDSWKAHDAAVLRVAWAHPEYGQVLATASFDRSVRIWEEQEEGIEIP